VARLGRLWAINHGKKKLVVLQELEGVVKKKNDA
jgi:hypothetical protein